MEVWFIGMGKDKGKFENVKMNAISIEEIKKKMVELGIKEAKVISWHGIQKNEWGIIKLKEESL